MKTRRLNLITVSDYLFAVSNEPCELNELCLHDEPNKGYELAYYGQGVINPLKIEGHLLLAKDGELPINKNLLPPLEQEDDVERLAEYSSEVQEATYTTQHKITYKHGFEDGYNKAKERYKFTEEDMRKAFIKGTNHGSAYQSCIENEDWEAIKEMDENDDDTINEIIQSLSQPKIPIAFECEVEELYAEDGKTKVGEDLAVEIIEGFTAYLSGKYIYE